MKTILHKALAKAGQLAATPIKDPDIPERLIISTRQHAGAACEVAVEKDAEVLRGQVIAKAQDPASADILCPVAGTVIDILPKHPTLFGDFAPAVVVAPGDEPDRAEELESIENYIYADREKLWSMLERAGVVATGPGAQPLSALLNPALAHKRYVSNLLVLGFDPEPMVCTNRRVLLDNPERAAWGVALLRHLLGGPRTTLVVHDKDYKPAMKKLQDFAGIDLIDTAPPMYPDNLPELLVKKFCGKEIPMGKTAADVDVAVVTLETAVAALKAVRFGEPHTHKIVTVTGEGIYWPRILRAPIGMRLGDLVEACGGLRVGVEFLVAGGPMRGTANYDRNASVSHETDAVLAFFTAGNEPVSDSPCINCGDCVQACPVNLQPNLLSRYCEFRLFENAASITNLYACIECGMCGYVCPARRPMLQYIRTAKHELAEAARIQAELDAAAEAEAEEQEPDAQPEAYSPDAEKIADETVADEKTEEKAEEEEEKTEEEKKEEPAEQAEAKAEDAGEEKIEEKAEDKEEATEEQPAEEPAPEAEEDKKESGDESAGEEKSNGEKTPEQ